MGNYKVITGNYNYSNYPPNYFDSYRCAFPIDEAKAAIQQQELDSELVVGSLHPSASGSKCRGAPFFAPFPRDFSKRTNRTVLNVFLAF